MTLDLIAVGDVMLDGAMPMPVVGRRVHGRITLRPVDRRRMRRSQRCASGASCGRRPRRDGRCGRLVADDLAVAGVEVLLARDEDAPTGCVVVLGGSTIVADPGASALLVPDDVPATLEAGVGPRLRLLAPAGGARGGRPRGARAGAGPRWLAVDAASAGLVTAFGVDRFFAATAKADVLLANAEEALALTGLEGEAAALELARRYRVACVKLGSEGAVAASAGVAARAVVRPIEAAGTLGAGDFLRGRAVCSPSPVAPTLAGACRLVATRRRGTIAPSRVLFTRPCRWRRYACRSP